MVIIPTSLVSINKTKKCIGPNYQYYKSVRDDSIIKQMEKIDLKLSSFSHNVNFSQFR